jgi:hypothetical protein
MSQTSAPYAAVYTLPPHWKKSGVWDVLKSFAKWCPPLLSLFQLSVVLGLALLSTFLQYEFYLEHDVLPGYAAPLAVAGSLAMIALLTLKLLGPAHWIRQTICGGYYLFMIASTSFHVFSHTWEQVASEAIPSSLTEPAQPASLDPVTQALTGALQKATKDGAWSTMRDIAGKLPKPTVTTIQTPRPKPLGISRESMNWIGAGILIVLRALLEAAQALCVVALKRPIPNVNKPTE